MKKIFFLALIGLATVSFAEQESTSFDNQEVVYDQEVLINSDFDYTYTITEVGTFEPIVAEVEGLELSNVATFVVNCTDEGGFTLTDNTVDIPPSNSEKFDITTNTNDTFVSKRNYTVGELPANVGKLTKCRNIF